MALLRTKSLVVVQNPSVESEKDISCSFGKFRLPFQTVKALCSVQLYYSIFKIMYRLYSILQAEVKRCLSWLDVIRMLSGTETGGKIWTSNSYMLKLWSSPAKAWVAHLSSCALYRPLWYVFIVIYWILFSENTQVCFQDSASATEVGTSLVVRVRTDLALVTTLTMFIMLSLQEVF